MRRTVKLPTWMGIALALGLGAQTLAAGVSGNPYRVIAARNVFGLNPPHPAPEPPPPPLAKVKVVGITTFGEKRALLKVHLPPKPPEPAREIACILKVGQREGPVEVLEIDEKARSVKVNNSGTIMALALGKESPSQPQAPPLPSNPLLSFRAALQGDREHLISRAGGH